MASMIDSLPTNLKCCPLPTSLSCSSASSRPVLESLVHMHTISTQPCMISYILTDLRTRSCCFIYILAYLKGESPTIALQN